MGNSNIYDIIIIHIVLELCVINNTLILRLI